MTQILTELCEALPSFLDGRTILDSMYDRNQKNWKIVGGKRVYY